MFESMKNKMAKKIVSMMDDKKKREMIQKFHDEHKDDADYERNMKTLKNMLKYTDDDVPV